MDSSVLSCVRASVIEKLSRKARHDGFDHVELRSSVVVIISGKLVGQRLIQRHDGHIDEEHVSEAIETPPQLITAG